MSNNELTRRNFIKKSAGTLIGLTAFPYIIPSNIIGKNKFISPSDKIRIGCIGLGWQGPGNMDSFLNEPDAIVVAVCDIDKNHLIEGKKTVDNFYGNNDCKTYHDYKELLAREDIDVVSIAVPDHWHGIISIAALQAGKDVYGEKPLSHNLMEGRAICDTVKKYNRIWQTGSWQRSQSHFRFACELVRNGRIGKVHTVEVGLPSGNSDFGGNDIITEPPTELDYETWLGPAPLAPYCSARVHKSWRWNLDYGGGQFLDWIGHHGDIAHWGLGFDNTGPIEISGVGEYPKTGIFNTANKYRVETKYANGVKMILAGGHPDVCNGGMGTKWIGDEGWVWVDRGERLDSSNKLLLQDKIKPNEIHLFKSPGHMRNFLDCVRSRQETLTPCETAHRSATPGHLGQISMLLGRTIKFNPETEEIINDTVASRLLGRPMRSPYHL
ncbi:MAG: Gfo/Idh/MocA family oxidoreductase [Ignavibacteriae bacterium]|nr:Gfo/Idh/MocA family oxidoreductase [Ignavibacteriota bacterium]